MMQHPEKVYPCDCMSHGMAVTTIECLDGDSITIARDSKSEDECNLFTVGISQWGVGYHNDGRYSWRDRLRHIWRIIRKGHPWLDQVDMTPETAKMFAHHILYVVDKMKFKLEHKQDELKQPQGN